MRLTRRQIDDYRIKIHQIAHTQPIIYENGTFEIYGVDESDKSVIMRKLQNEPFISRVNATASSYNFGKFKFNRGFADPERKYNIRGILNEPEDIEEVVKCLKRKNPTIWDENNELLPDVREAIENIVDQFKEDLENKDAKIKIDDVYLIGSNANYNYTKDSDIDIHIIADESFDCDDKHLPIIYDAFKSIFNNKYDITIKDIPVEIYVESAQDIKNVSSGEYSLDQGWIKEPVYEKIPPIDKVSLEKEVGKWEKRYLDITENPVYEDIQKYLNDIYDKRAESVKEHNEFAPGNLLFKELRNLGYLDNLKKMLVDLKSEELSID